MNVIIIIVYGLLAFTAGKLVVGEECKTHGTFYAAAHYTCSPTEKPK